MEEAGEPKDSSENLIEEGFVDKDIETNELIVLDPDATEVDFNHGRIAKIDNLECLTQVEGLYLRWNLIKKIENISMLTT